MTDPTTLQILESLSNIGIKSIILAIPLSLAVLAFLQIKEKDMKWITKIGFTLVVYFFVMYILCSVFLLQLHSEYSQYLNFEAYIANFEWDHKVSDQIYLSIVTPLASISTIFTFIGSIFLKELKNGELIKIRWSARIGLTIMVFVFCFIGFGFICVHILDLPIPAGSD